MYTKINRYSASETMLNSRIVKKDIDDLVSRFPFINELKGKTVAVTGATGLIGSLLIRFLIEIRESCGIEVRVIGIARNAEKVKNNFSDPKLIWFTDVNLEEGKLPDIGDVDFMLHCASPTASNYFVTHPVETYLTSIQGTNAILEYARSHSVKSIVYLSSLEYYGVVEEERDIYERDFGRIDPYDVRSSYSLGKRLAESLCFAYFKEYDVPVKVARLTQVFGAGISPSDNRVFAQFARSAIRGETIELHTEGKSAKPYSHTMDTLEAIFYLLFKGKNGEAYNVANPDTYTNIRKFAEMVQLEFNPSKGVEVKLDSSRGYAPDTKLKLNVDKLKSLGWLPHKNLKEMMADLIEYLKETQTVFPK